MSSSTTRASASSAKLLPPQIDSRKKQAVEALNKRYSELNKLWEHAEAELKQIPIPFDVIFAYKTEDAYPERPNDTCIRSWLGFVRAKGGWRICYDVTHDDFPEHDYDWKPITECRVDVRLEAVPHIGVLRERVLKAAEECVPALDKAISEFRNTLQSW